MDRPQDCQIKSFFLSNGERISCVRWQNQFYITGTDILKIVLFRIEQECKKTVKNLKKFEEGIFSDLRCLKIGRQAVLEEPSSRFLNFLLQNRCIRTKKKQKVFFWTAVDHDELFQDTLIRESRRGLDPLLRNPIDPIPSSSNSTCLTSSSTSSSSTSSSSTSSTSSTSSSSTNSTSCNSSFANINVNLNSSTHPITSSFSSPPFPSSSFSSSSFSSSSDSATSPTLPEPATSLLPHQNHKALQQNSKLKYKKPHPHPHPYSHPHSQKQTSHIKEEIQQLPLTAPTTSSFSLVPKESKFTIELPEVTEGTNKVNSVEFFSASEKIEDEKNIIEEALGVGYIENLCSYHDPNFSSNFSTTKIL